jgi:O-glycosyl hydrolase
VDLSVNTSTTYQTIDGFGAALPMWGSNSWSDSDAQKLVGTGDNELGLSIVRTIIEPLDGNNLSNKNTWNTHTNALLAVQKYGGTEVQIMACPWSPPAAWKSNAALNNGGKLLPQYYDAYANYLNSYVTYMKDKGVKTNVVSIQNEPNWHPDYPSGDWSAEEYRVFLRDHGQKIQNTKLMVGETIGFQKSFTDTTLNDASAAANIDYISGHLYGPWDDVNHKPATNNLLSAYPLATQKGKHVWMTEWNHHKADNVNNADPVGGSVIWQDPQHEGVWNETLDDVMNSVHNAMEVNWNAYVWWWGRRYYSFIGETRTDVPNYSTPAGEILKRGWAFSQYSKFVRPGYKRVALSKTTKTNGLDITAYQGDNKLVLVILNRTNASVTNMTLGTPYKITNTEYFSTSRYRNREKMASSFSNQTVAIPEVGARSISTIVVSYGANTGTTSSSSMSSSSSAPSNSFAQNGDAESGINNWGTTATTASVTRSTSEHQSGTASVFITGRQAAWHGLTFNVGRLTDGNQYNVSVWVKLAAGTPDAAVTLTAKRQDDSDASTYNEFTNITTITASATEWRQLQGIYTQLGTAFEHFIIQSADTTASFYADSFSIQGDVAVGVPAACSLPKAPQWESTAPLISAKNGAFGIKDPSIVQYNGKYHIWATINDGTWRSVYLNFTDWNQADAATQVPMTGTRVGNTVAPQIFYYRPHNLWYNFTQWGRGYSTTTDIENVNSWTARKDFLTNGPAADSSKPELDYWVICDDANCHLFFARDDGVLYKSKTTRANFPNFNGYSIVMEDHRGNGNSFLFEAPNVYKIDGTNQYLLTVEAYRTPGYGPRYFRSWTATSLDGPWTAHADTEEAPFAGEANVTWPTGNKWATGISHGEMVRSGYDEYLTIDPCNMQFLYQGDSGTSLNGGYGGEPYKLGLLKLKK